MIDRLSVADRSDRTVWRAYRKVTATEMRAAEGPLEVATREGIYTLPEGWRGFIAVDPDGYPYPVELDAHRVTYEPVE